MCICVGEPGEDGDPGPPGKDGAPGDDGKSLMWCIYIYLFLNTGYQ